MENIDSKKGDSMKPMNRINAALRLACLALSLFFAGAAQAQTQVIEFDDQTDGTLIAEQYPLVTFFNSPMVVNVASRWPGLATFSPPMALYKGSAGPIVITFARPQGRVRVYVGCPFVAGGACQAVLRAYAPGGKQPMATVSTALPTYGGATNMLEVLRPLDGDISAVEIEIPGMPCTLLDHLEYEIIRPAYHGVVDFDDAPVGHVVWQDYPGVTFPGQPVVIGVGLGGIINTYSPPNALRNPHVEENDDPAPMSLLFNPPQGMVRVQVGNPYPFPLHIVMRAYYDSFYNFPPSTLLGTVSVDLAPYTDIATPLEILSWTNQNINTVVIDYGSNEWEYIDHLEFGPNVPAGLADTNPPCVYIDSPTNGTSLVRTDPVAPQYVTITGRIWEDTALRQVTFYQDHDGTNVITDTDFLDETVSYPTPPSLFYRFYSINTLLDGTNHFKLVAVDLAGNTSTNAEREIVIYSHIPEPLVVSNLSPTTIGSVALVRVNGASGPQLQIPPTIPSVIFTGTNLHSQTAFFLLPEGEPFEGSGTPVTILSRAPDLSSVTVQIPDNVPWNAGNYHWWIYDFWPGTNYWFDAGILTVTNTSLPYPALWGFGFHNAPWPGSWFNYQGVYSNNIFLGSFPPLNCPPSYDPLYLLLWFPIYCGIMDNMNGTCSGFSAESLMMYWSYTFPFYFDPDAAYPSGFLVPGTPEGFVMHACGPDETQNLWANIVANQGVLLSRDVFICAVNQMGGGVRGSPRDRLNQLRPWLAASNFWYALSLMPGVGAGHTLVPYAIEDQPDGRHSYILVYDCNRPFRVDQDPSTSTNFAAVSAYVDVDTLENTYSFTMADGHVWSGTGMYLLPLNLWLQGRHAPGIDLVGEGAYLLLMIICGSADGQYATPDGNTFGWDQTGAFTDTIPDSVPYSPDASADRTNRNAFLVFQTNNYPSIDIQANVRQDGRYLFHTAQNGCLLQLEVLNAHGGDTEFLGIGCTNQITNQLVRSFYYMPARPATVFWPKVGLSLGTNEHAVFRWYGLNLGGGDLVEFRALPEASAVELANYSANTLSPSVVLNWASANNAVFGTNAFTLPPIPPNAVQRLTLTQWPPVAGKLSVGMDTNGDGVIDYTQIIQGTAFTNLPPVPGSLAITVDENSANGIAITQLLAAATDPNGDTLTIPSVMGSTLNGGAATLTNGMIIYVPATNYVGPDTLIYTLADSYQTVDGTLAVTVNGITNPPPALPPLPCQTNGIQYLQLPDPQNGVDVLAGTNGNTPGLVLADDFICTNAGPVTEIHLWCAWLNDVVDTNTSIWLGIYDDMPATNNQPGQPGNLLWSQWFNPGDYVPNPYLTSFEPFYNPSNQVFLGSDTNLYYYCFSLFLTNGFLQLGTADAPQTNWLAVYAQPSGGLGAQFGWKTSAVQQHEAATWTIWTGAPPAGGWQPLVNTNSMPLDLSFNLTTASNCPPPVLLCYTNLIQCGSGWTFDPPTIVDPCCGTNGTPTLVAVTNLGSCPWVIQATWAYTNCFGDTALGTGTIIVQDTNPPTLIAPPGGDLGLNPVVPDDTAMLAQLAVSDNCGMLLTNVWHVDAQTGTNFNRTFTIIAKDICLNLAATNVVYTWTEDPNAPLAIIAQPQSQTAPAGSEVTLTVVATGVPTLAYQWFFNSAALPGAAGASLVLPNFQSTNQGSYSVTVSNTSGAVTSQPAKVYLEAPLRFVNPAMTNNGWFQSRLVGQAGGNYAIYWSTNLQIWYGFSTNEAPLGFLDFVDTNTPAVRPGRFYRGQLAP
jgi:hypothetical protein